MVLNDTPQAGVTRQHDDETNDAKLKSNTKDERKIETNGSEAKQEKKFGEEEEEEEEE